MSANNLGAPFRVVFLSTRNAARSILAEAIMNAVAPEKFVACSAGIYPEREVDPHVLQLLRTLGHPVEHLRPKPFYLLSGPEQFDFVISIYDDITGETCPAWPGQAISSYWPIPDPATAEARQGALALADACRMLSRRIRAFASLPVPSLRRRAMRQA